MGNHQRLIWHLRRNLGFVGATVVVCGIISLVFGLENLACGIAGGVGATLVFTASDPPER